MSPYEISVNKTELEEKEQKNRLEQFSKINLINCVNCDCSVSERADKCPKCGTAIKAACGICKSMIPRSEDVCPECGDPDPFNNDFVKLNVNVASTIAGENEEVSTNMEVSQQSEIRDSNCEVSKGRKGVKGWLSFLIAQMMIIGPIFGAALIGGGFYQEERNYSPLMDWDQWKLYKSITWIAFVLTALISFVGGWGLMRGSDRSVVERAKTILWITGPVATIVLGLIIPIACLGKEMATAEFIVQFIVYTLLSVIVTVFWTSYLSKSKRVLNTYDNVLVQHRCSNSEAPSDMNRDKNVVIEQRQEHWGF